MPVGIELTDDSGNTVINPDMKNFGLITSGRVYANTSFVDPSIKQSYVDITSTGRSSPLLALHGDSWCGVLSVTVSGGQYTWRVLGATGTQIDYWIFDEVPNPAENVGLEAFNSAGERIFHSGVAGLRVLDFYSDQVVAQSYSSLVSEKIAFVQGRPAKTEILFQDAYPGQANPNALTTAVYGASLISADEISVHYVPFKTEAVSSTSEVTDPLPEILIVDVSNLGTYGAGDPPADVTPNTVDWTNISSTPNEATSNTQTINGIDTPITIEATSSNANHVIKAIVAGVEQSAGPVVVTNGQSLAFEIGNYQQTAQSGTITVTNLTDNNTVLDTFTCALGASTDVTPDPIDFTNISNLAVSEANTNIETISGLGSGQSIDISVSSNNPNIVVTMFKNGAATGQNPSSYSNSDSIMLRVANFDTVSSQSATITVTNDTDSGTDLDTFTVSLGKLDFGGGGL